MNIIDMEHTSESMQEDDAANRIQIALKRTFQSRIVWKKFTQQKSAVESAKHLLQAVSVFQSFEKAQLQVLAPNAQKVVSQLLSLLPKDPLQKEKNSIITLSRKFLTGLLIPQFGEDILGSSVRELPVVSAELTFAAKLLHRSYLKVLTFISENVNDSVHLTSMKMFAGLLSRARFSLRYFLHKLAIWKSLDAQYVARSLEDTFAQSYLALLSAKIGLQSGQITDWEIVSRSEQQVHKLLEVMKQLLGAEQAKSRTEEIMASLEAQHAEYLYSNGSAVEDVTSPMSPTSPIPSTTASRIDSTKLQRSLTPPPPPTTSSTNQIAVQDTEQAKQQAQATKYLSLLSALAGIDNERLAYEITLDRHYRLPSTRTQSALNTPAVFKGARGIRADPISVAAKLKEKMLLVLADKLINTLRYSNVEDVSQLEEDMVVMIRDQEAEDSANTAMITRLYPSPADANIKLMSIRYVVEDTTEDNVAIGRVKLSTEPLLPMALISSLNDIAYSIAAFTPNREDIQSQLKNAFDAEQLAHLIMNNVINPMTDILPILTFIYRSAMSLLPPHLLETCEKWLQDFETAFVAENMLSLQAKQRWIELRPPAEITAGMKTAHDDGGSHKSWQDVIPLIPIFLERVTEMIEEIQRDLANYYIASLVPVLQIHGAAFLSQRFKERLMSGLARLDLTAGWLQMPLLPESSLLVTNTMLTEAEMITVPITFQALAATTDENHNSVLTPPLVAMALCNLLQVPFRLDAEARLLPETLQWDGNRLASMRDLVDLIALESSLVITARKLLGQFYQVAAREAEEIELQHRLDVLLRDTAEGGVSMANIIEEVIAYIQHAIYRAREASASTAGAGAIIRQNSLGEEKATPSLIHSTGRAAAGTGSAELLSYDPHLLRERVEKSIKEVLAEGNPVLNLFTKRVYKILLRAMLGKPYLHLLPLYSLQSKGQERNLAKLVEIGTKLFRHTMIIHGDLYADVLKMIAQQIMIQQQERQQASEEAHT